MSEGTVLQRENSKPEISVSAPISSDLEDLRYGYVVGRSLAAFESVGGDVSQMQEVVDLEMRFGLIEAYCSR